SLLRAARDLGALRLRAFAARPRGLRAHLEAVPPDVREHRHRHRQRARRALAAARTPARQAGATPVRRQADAGPAGPGTAGRDRGDTVGAGVAEAPGREA